MNSHARLTYTQVWKAVGEDDAEAKAQVGALLPQVQQLFQLYHVLAKARTQRGAIEFSSSEVRFVLDNTGEVTQAGMLVRNDAHKLIEECMIAANVEAARYLIAHRSRRRSASTNARRSTSTKTCWNSPRSSSSACRHGARCGRATTPSC